MFSLPRILFFLNLFLLIRNSMGCLPTQNVEPTTLPPFPCDPSYCPKIYKSTCQGFGIPSISNWCPTADEIPVTYTIGTLEDEGFSSPDVCQTYLSCPAGTKAMLNVVGTGYINGNADGSPQLAYCSVSGNSFYSAATWYSHRDVADDFEISDIVCQNV